MHNEDPKTILTIEIPEAMRESLVHYCAMTGTNMGTAVRQALMHLLRPYESDYKEPLSGIYVTASGEWKACFILGKCERYGQPYYRIVSDGQLMAAPKDFVKVMA